MSGSVAQHLRESPSNYKVPDSILTTGKIDQSIVNLSKSNQSVCAWETPQAIGLGCCHRIRDEGRKKFLRQWTKVGASDSPPFEIRRLWENMSQQWDY
ncbi:hypothetical protein EVAR_15774_1 [Eumeta japonica]|uniref:Uncharacterized protein n=1 Tax=Eumeta variegata TaxID=151549 RepID=A0A4C1U0T7_EUMVA|nr:hypothetical protein EVAR_15774_1 [Eumeta japonica]